MLVVTLLIHVLIFIQ